MRNVLVHTMNLSGLSQKWRSLKNKIYKKRVMFVHVPKCGGTSLSHVLRVAFSLSNFKLDEGASRAAATGFTLGQWMVLKRRLVAYQAAVGTHFIQGHFPVDSVFLDALKGDYQFITLLREPTERVISHYHYDRHKLDMSPAEFLRSPRGAVESRVLCHFFGELDFDFPGDVDAAAARAISNLERFAVVGILEDQTSFSHQCEQALGLRLSLPRRNVGTDRQLAHDAFGSVERARLREMCAADVRIYEHFCARREPRNSGHSLTCTPSRASK